MGNTCLLYEIKFFIYNILRYIKSIYKTGETEARETADESFIDAYIPVNTAGKDSSYEEPRR